MMSAIKTCFAQVGLCNRLISKLVYVSLLLSSLLSCSIESRIEASEDERTSHMVIVDSIVQSMSIEEKIGQLLMPGISGTTMNKYTKETITKFRPGGVILFGYNYDNPAQVTALNASVQEEAAKLNLPPLFISIDQEGGRVKRVTEGVTQFPGNMALGSANNEKISYYVAKITGLQLRMHGINMNLTPDIDVNNNPDNPIINTRSFGSDPRLVAIQGAAYVKGLQGGSCIAVAKHFPGHGDTANDSHKTLPIINYDMERLSSVELVPFKEAVSAGVEAIMSAHILYPQIETSELPATLSKKFLTDILGEEMKFEGIVMTDDLEMGAIAGNMKLGDASVVAVNAGVDIILVTTSRKLEEIYGSIRKALDDGVITEERLDNSVKKIISAKLRYNIMSKDAPYIAPLFTLSESDAKLIGKSAKLNLIASQKALYFKKGSEGQPLLSAGKKVLFSNQPYFRKLTKAKGFAVYPRNKALSYQAAADERIYCEVRDRDAKSIAALQKRYGKKLVLLSTDNPFKVSKYSAASPVLFSFSDTVVSYQALATALAGDYEPKTTVPINLGFGR